MRVYIAGPMRGIAAYNFPAFDAAARRIKAVGWEPVSPAEMDRLEGLYVDYESAGFLRLAMSRDMQAIASCTGIAMLPGWRGSAGAVAELAVAYVLRLRVLDAESLQDITCEVYEWWSSVLGKRQ